MLSDSISLTLNIVLMLLLFLFALILLGYHSFWLGNLNISYRVFS